MISGLACGSEVNPMHVLQELDTELDFSTRFQST